MSGPLLIIGASGRAAAATARRLGYDPFVIDLFADADTQQLASCLRCPFEQYPDGFLELSTQAPPGPWMYTGALENYPDVIETISRDRPLIGNGLSVIAEVRDPFRLAEIIPDHVPRLSDFVPPAGTWLIKPKAGAAGIGIRQGMVDEIIPEGCFAQEFIGGPSMSALFIDGDLLGVTEQLIGTDWLHAPAFRYAGNIGPLPDQPLSLLQTIGRRLVRETGLCGDWGMDFMLRADGKPLVIEINPRYTAARELFDYAAMTDTQTVFAKGIYYAPGRILFPAAGPWADQPCDITTRPEFADIPNGDQQHEPGQPVISMLVDGATAEDCREQLRRRAADMDRRLTPVGR